jgi:hypothetical protein
LTIWRYLSAFQAVVGDKFNTPLTGSGAKRKLNPLLAPRLISFTSVIPATEPLLF